MGKQARIVNIEAARASSRRASVSRSKRSARSGNSRPLKASWASASTSARKSVKMKSAKSTPLKNATSSKRSRKGASVQFSSKPAAKQGRVSSFFANLSRGRAVALTVCVCLLATIAFLYAPAKNYYIAQRDQAKAQVAYEIVSSRNAALVEDVAMLSSTDGMEDKVRQQYGWVKEGENAVVVAGLQESGEPSVAEVLRTTTLNDIKAPETWYSPFFDKVFGYEN